MATAGILSFHAMELTSQALSRRATGKMQVDELIAHKQGLASFYSSGLAKIRNAGEWCNPGRW